jgi:hypothetical protein
MASELDDSKFTMTETKDDQEQITGYQITLPGQEWEKLGALLTFIRSLQ